MNTYSSPRAVARDASNRALRTLVQGLAVDILAAVAVVMTAAVAAGIDWTRAYWVALGLAVAKSAVTAIVSYVARTVVPPASPTTSAGAEGGTA